MSWSLLAAAVFAWLAGLLGTLALRASRRQVPYLSPLGLRGSKVRASVATWDAGHAQAAPFLSAAAAISLLQAAALAWAGLATSVQGTPYPAILVGTGALLIGLLLILAHRIGNRV